MTIKKKTREGVEQSFLLLLVAVATLAFVWLIGPFMGAILWGVIVAILFESLNARLLRAMPGRRNLAAFTALMIIVAVLIVPAMLLGAALVSEASAVFVRIQSGEIDLWGTFAAAESHLPEIARRWLADLGLFDIDVMKAKIGPEITGSFQAVAAKAFNLSQSMLGFFLTLGVMLYLTFFLLRDGHAITAKVERCLPLAFEKRSLLITRFVAVVRATIKGSAVVALLQGMIGGIVFWSLGIGSPLLWGVAMGVFSLFPAVGTALIWVPVTGYLLATGDVWQAAVLFLCGALIISSIDNIVRPILVGRDARIPDYIVLITTLGGFEVMGFNGFVIGPVIAALFMAVWEIFADVPSSAAETEPPT